SRGHSFSTGGGTIFDAATPSSFAFAVTPPKSGVLQGRSLFVRKISVDTSLIIWNNSVHPPFGTLSQACNSVTHACPATFFSSGSATHIDRFLGSSTPAGADSFTVNAVDNGTTGVPQDTYGIA